MMHEIEIIGLATRPTPATEPPRRRGGRGLAIVFVVAIAIPLGLSIARSSSNDLEQNERAAYVASTSTVPTSLSIGPAESVAESVTVSPIEGGVAGPLLGVDTGSVLVVRSIRENTLSLIDMDSGATASLGLSGKPMLVANGWLIIWDDGEGWAVNLDDPDTSRRKLLVDGEITRFGWVDGDRLFVSSRRDFSFFVYSMPIGQWDQRARLEAEVPRFPIVESAIPKRFDLMSLPGTGVYELDGGGGFELAHEGRLIAHTGDLAFIRQCDESYECSDSWYDRNGWDRRDEYQVAPNFTQLRILEGGRYVLSTGLDGVFLSDLETGREWDVHTLGLAFNDDALPVLPLGDGLVFQSTQGQFHYFELATAELTVLPFEINRDFELSLVVDRSHTLIRTALLND